MIQLLPDHIANQIAAGEVIQRPASVIKELVENSVDAGATSITVIITEAGRTLMQVVDNGCGMNVMDARMAFERHATSKICEFDDLQQLNTFGFRGEALASIAAVAEILMLTRRSEDEVGTQLHSLAGEMPQQTPAAAAVGTSISVKNLFYNIPARRKFLKSDSVELKHIVTEFMRVALCRPEVEMRLTHNTQELYHLPVSNLRQRIVNIMGKSINQQLVDIHVETSVVNIHGFIGKPDSAKRNNNHQFFFVNNRYFRSPYFQKAVTTAYDRLLASSESIPSFFIYFELPPANIDVNIHPAKTEIKFEDEQVIFQMLNAAIREALAKYAVAPSIDFDAEGAPEIPIVRRGMPMPSAPAMNFDPKFNPFEEGIKQNSGSRISGDKIDENWQKLYEGLPPRPNPSLTDTNNEVANSQFSIVNSQFIQLRGKYLLTPVKSGVMVIDIRRARQRIFYEQYVRLLANHQYESQQQIFAETITLKPEDYMLLEGMFDELQLLGYNISAFGNNTIVINGLPADLPSVDIREWIDELLAELHEAAPRLKEKRQSTIAASLAKTAAGHTADMLNSEEAQALIDILFACENPSICPLGKPITHIISLDELDKKLFKN
ncbi:MAG: DNA mismatch repair endonuclease MutL [Bacteroidales bacterium]|nr:DNA mismatch repair endonuclease MutL [Bacteroidales bacterium]